MKYLFFLVAFCFASLTLAQTSFKPGYFTTLNDERVECLIKNLDWLNSPEQIYYKVNENSITQIIKTSELKTFEVKGLKKYITVNTEVDESPNKTIKLVKKRLLIQVLIQGKANLFSYNNFKRKKYFYSIDDSEVTELIHKEYQAYQKDLGKYFVKENNDYLLKINEDVKCIFTSDFKRIKFDEKSLKKYFIEYNTCKNSELTFEKKTRKINLNLNVIAGLNQSKLNLDFNFDNELLDSSYSFKNNTSPTVGLELEAILPTNNYKHAAFVGLYYRSFESEAYNEATDENLTFEFSSVEFNLGYRHYMFLNEKSRLFVEINGAVDIRNTSSIYIPVSSGIKRDRIKSAPSLSIGAGYKYRKIGATIRYSFGRDLLQNGGGISASLSTVALLLSYTIL